MKSYFLKIVTSLTFILLMVGVYTKEVGADLTCGMKWPMCDGAIYGLFPANLPSAIEWSHRFLALVVGILILVALYKSWEIHGSKSRITKAVLLAVLLLPMQVILGALTVVKFELFSRGDRILFEPLISVSHNAIGVVILVSLFAAMLWEREL
ncbi:MAG TPA: cytochrome AA3 biosynthesis protein [Halobacteriales archaeon]|uniref:COX15/CtaA family protein n=1 Tax=Candidatus Hikarchaeum yamanae TaxID=2675326 RepID=UPI0017BD0D9D|nr:cytochrome AA3 biosynthesis protein [Halobacteriales archaeon]|tara:strand:- start:146714 stop:147172 length:459 start_codon:yes stop_codon:yes gene_type:complete